MLNIIKDLERSINVKIWCILNCTAILILSVKQKAIHELRLYCWKRGNKWGIQPFPSYISRNGQSSLFHLEIMTAPLFFQVLHYVEKPSTFVSDIINCGIYLFSPDIFQHIGTVFHKNQQDMLLWVEALSWGSVRGNACDDHSFHFFGSLHLSFFPSLILPAMISVSSHNHQISIRWVSWYISAARCSSRALSVWCELWKDSR